MCSTELTEVMKKMKILICRILKAVHYRVYKCTAILHTPMGRIHGKNSMSKLDNDAKRVANIYMELPRPIINVHQQSAVCRPIINVHQ